MGASILDLIENLGQLPLQIAKRFTDMLSSLITQFAAQAQQRLRQERLEEHGATVSGSGGKEFKKLHQFPDWLKGGNEKDLIRDDLKEDTPKIKPPGAS